MLSSSMICFEMDAIECFTSSNERLERFLCSPSETCCGSQCCAASGPFYTHWYFWLAVSMFLLFVVGIGVSACLHFRKQRMHKRCSTRTKPAIGADLLLNYHLMRIEGLNPPLYAERDPGDQLHQAGTPLSPPPPYTHIHNRIDWGQTSGEYSDQPPPSYSECVKQDGSHSLHYCNG